MNIRIAQHRRSAANGSSLAVHAAWRKYGEPVVDVLAEYASQEDVSAAEISMIAELGTVSPNGYNICAGGETAPSKNPEVAAKISAAAVGRKYEDTSPWSAASAEKWKDGEYRDKVVSSLAKSWEGNDDRKRAMSERMKAMWAQRKETGWKMAETHRAAIASRVFSDETRAKMSESAKARARTPLSEEARARLSAATKAFWQNPENRALRGKQVAAGHARAKSAR